MPHVIEHATTGRAKCRACGDAIAKDTLRVGEAVPNMFSDTEGAEARHWYHATCAAYRRPEAFLQAVADAAVPPPEREALIAIAAEGVTHHRLPRLDRAERASSGRATCRHCRDGIPKDTWRIALLFWQDGRFAPAGFVHAACAAVYFDTAALLDRLRHFTPGLTEADTATLMQDIAAGAHAAPGAAAASDQV